jgi:predicted RNase H-like HicB family nuclease
MQDALEFIALIRKDEGGAYTSSFPDFPGCTAIAASEDEAIDMGVDALADQIEEMRQAGEAIPAPSSFIQVTADPQWRGALAILVRPGVKPLNRPSMSLGRIGGANEA